MFRHQWIAHHWFSLIFFLVIAFGLGGCSIKLTADYDANTFEEILKVAKKVDRFYGNLLEVPQEERRYSRYAEQYVEIETDIRSFVTRTKAKPFNEESTNISEIILKLWIKYKRVHQTNDGYHSGVAELDRGRFVRLFNAAAAAEEAKKLNLDDRDVGMESKEGK